MYCVNLMCLQLSIKGQILKGFCATGSVSAGCPCLEVATNLTCICLLDQGSDIEGAYHDKQRFISPDMLKKVGMLVMWCVEMLPIFSSP